jgi:hypothetical protein
MTPEIKITPTWSEIAEEAIRQGITHQHGGLNMSELARRTGYVPNHLSRVATGERKVPKDIWTRLTGQPTTFEVNDQSVQQLIDQYGSSAGNQNPKNILFE